MARTPIFGVLIGKCDYSPEPGGYSSLVRFGATMYLAMSDTSPSGRNIWRVFLGVVGAFGCRYVLRIGATMSPARS